MCIIIFDIAIGANECMTEEGNHFLRAHEIIDVKKELAMLGVESCWNVLSMYAVFEEVKA